MELSYSSVVTLRHTEGSLLANGVPIRTVDRVNAGDLLEVRLPEPEPEALAHYDGTETARLVYADDWVAVYEKPPRMPTHPAHYHQSDTLANVFRADFPGRPFRAVGRLDADTSGLILLALDGYGAFWFPERVHKTYLALTVGRPPEDEGVVDAPLLPVEKSDGRHRVSADGLPARTRYRVLEENNGLALVSCELETGRTHQIRAHMAHIGCPLLGDARYGEPDPRLDRHALHCAELRFSEPDGEERVLRSEPEFMGIIEN